MAHQLAALYRLALDRLRSEGPARAGVAGIVFSKDRPMQLAALLESHAALVSRPCPLTILFQASTDEFATAYRELRGAWGGRGVAFTAQEDFRGDLIRMLEATRAAKLFFLVDDIIFINPFDLAEFAAFDTASFVPSLRHGACLRRCYSMAAPQTLPPFRASVAPAGFLCWQWKDGALDWGYPLSVDGHLFDAAEVLLMARASPFANPNAFERALQTFAPCFADRLGVAYDTPRIVNIPANRVQSEERNRSGSVSEHELLEKWRQGYRIDVGRYAGLAPDAVHMELPLHLARR
jgi:hypothetical protein